MAFEADCGVSTVLEESRVASTVGFLVPGECWATCSICGLDISAAVSGLLTPAGREQLKTQN